VAEIERAYGKRIHTAVKPGSGGIFDVAVDGEMVFRKWDEGRFPSAGEILGKIGERLEKG